MGQAKWGFSWVLLCLYGSVPWVELASTTSLIMIPGFGGHLIQFIYTITLSAILRRPGTRLEAVFFVQQVNCWPWMFLIVDTELLIGITHKNALLYVSFFLLFVLGYLSARWTWLLCLDFSIYVHVLLQRQMFFQPHFTNFFLQIYSLLPKKY